MRRTALMLSIACGLQAAGGTVDGPRLGYVNSRAGVRGVLGLVGASRLSAPVTGELPDAQVLPGSDWAVAKNGAGALVRVHLSDGAVSSFGIENVLEFAVSPSGAFVLARTGDRLHAISTSSDDRSEHALPSGSVTQMAIDDEGSRLAIVVSEADAQALYLVDAGGSRRVSTAARMVGVAFAPGSDDAAFLDGDGRVFALNKHAEVAEIASIPGASAIAIAGDRRAIVSAGSEVVLIKLDGSATTKLACTCDAKMARPLGQSKFVLTAADDAPMWILDASSEEARIAFVPGATNE